VCVSRSGVHDDESLLPAMNACAYQEVMRNAASRYTCVTAGVLCHLVGGDYNVLLSQTKIAAGQAKAAVLISCLRSI